MQKTILKLFWQYSTPYKSKRTLALAFPVFAVLINGILAPYILSLFIDRLKFGGITFDNSLPIIITYAITVFTGEVIMWRLALYFSWTFEVNSQRDLYTAIFEKLSREDMMFHANRFGGSLVSQSSKLIGAFERFWDMIIWNIVPMLTTIAGAIVALSALGLWQYGMFLTIYACIFISIVIIRSRFMVERNRQEAAASNATSGYLADMVTNVMTVKSFGQEKYELQKARSTVDDWMRKSFRLRQAVLITTGLFSSMYAFGATAALVFAVLASQNGIASVGMIYLIFMYALNVNRQLWEMNNITRTYNRVLGDAHEMALILTTDYRLVDHGKTQLVVPNGAITFRDVAFSHDRGEGEHVFNNFNLEIPAGQRVGIVGHSGSGKTTLTRILLRFSDIDKGSILIDGQDVGLVTQRSLHHAIAFVPQEPMLFHRSLRENIAYGKTDASDNEVINAAKEAYAWEFIDKLKDGLDTTVGERGVKLSGGQRQRIAIARAILKDAPILVLDEATSALDSESEKLIQASLANLMQGRTSIVIAHRLSTISKLDRIVVLDNGKIVEDGTHEELLALSGTYAKLWSHQSGGFIEE